MRLSRILLALILLMAAQSARAQQPSPSLDEQCSVPADQRWTPQEKFVWDSVCVGKHANFNEESGYGGKLDPMNWPQNRVLRPGFLKNILLKDPYRSALTSHGVVIYGARFTEAIDLEGAAGTHEVPDIAEVARPLL